MRGEEWVLGRSWQSDELEAAVVCLRVEKEVVECVTAALRVELEKEQGSGVQD
jgi:hypothetical protein